LCKNLKEEEFMKRFALIVLTLTLAGIAHAGWTRTYGGPLDDMGNRVFQTSDGGYIICGITWSFGAGKSDIWLLKTDSQGDTLWTKTYGGSDYENVVCLNQTQDGGYILAAQTFSFDTYGKSDVWILKVNSLGDTLWTLVYGTETRDFPGYVGERPEGGYVVIGGAEYGGLDNKIFFLSVDEQGKLEYAKDHRSFCTCANKFSDSLYLVVSTNDVLELSSQGDSLWWVGDATVWMTNWIERDNSASDTFLFTGCEYQSELEVPDLFVGCGDLFDGAGWGIWYGGPSTMEIGFCIRSTADNGFIVVGSKETERPDDNLWLIKEGPTSWDREFGGFNDDAGFYVDMTSDGGYIITGITGSYGGGGSDLWLIKTDSLGYVGVAESITHQPDWQVTPIGSQIVLRYSDKPQGFHASIFDASGRKVDELHSTMPDGVLKWGMNRNPGVYFVVPLARGCTRAQKVVLVK
jgi:hypothetical protein